MTQLMSDGKFSSEAEIARWLERDPSTFNRWVNGFSHPRTDEDWRVLTRLGVNSGFLRRLELLDKLDAWRADMDMTVEELVTLAVQVQNQKHGGVIFRVDPGRREEAPEERRREEIA